MAILRALIVDVGAVMMPGGELRRGWLPAALAVAGVVLGALTVIFKLGWFGWGAGLVQAVAGLLMAGWAGGWRRRLSYAAVGAVVLVVGVLAVSHPPVWQRDGWELGLDEVVAGRSADLVITYTNSAEGDAGERVMARRLDGGGVVWERPRAGADVAVAGDWVLLLDDGPDVALVAADGSQAWQQDLNSSDVLAVYGGIAVVGGESDQGAGPPAQGVDLSSGEVIYELDALNSVAAAGIRYTWILGLDRGRGIPVESRYLLSSTGAQTGASDLTAWDITTGQSVWRRPPDLPPETDVQVTGRHIVTVTWTSDPDRPDSSYEVQAIPLTGDATGWTATLPQPSDGMSSRLQLNAWGVHAGRVVAAVDEGVNWADLDTGHTGHTPLPAGWSWQPIGTSTPGLGNSQLLVIGSDRGSTGLFDTTTGAVTPIPADVDDNVETVDRQRVLLVTRTDGPIGDDIRRYDVFGPNGRHDGPWQATDTGWDTPDLDGDLLVLPGHNIDGRIIPLR